MSTSVTWNGVTYSIPAAGEVGWSALSNFLIALGNDAAIAQEMKQAIRVATTTPVTVSNTTDCVVATNLSVAGAVAVNLPAGTDGRWFVIVDQKGDAATNNITITPNGAETINGSATFVMNQNKEGVILAYSLTNTRWNVVGRFTAGAPLTNPMATTGDMIYGAGGGAATKLATGATTGLLHGGNGAVPSWSLLVDADVSASAAIAYSKLNLATSIVDADVSGSAAIAGSKIASASASVAGVVNNSAQTFGTALKTFQFENADTNVATASMFDVRRTTSGTAAAGFGGALNFGIENGSGNVVDAVQFRPSLTTVTNGAEVSRFGLFVMTGGTLTERLSVTGAGALTAGATDQQIQNTIRNNSTSSSVPALQVRNHDTSSGSDSCPALKVTKGSTTNTTSQVLVQFEINTGGNGQGQINGNGANAANFGSFSDERIKENIVDLGPQLDSIMNLRPVEFDYRADIPGIGAGHQIGFVAQEMAAVYSDVVSEGADGWLQVTGWSKTEARLVKAIQELAAEVSALKLKLGETK